MRPVLLLDVDGVVNAMAKNPPLHVYRKSQWNHAKIRGADGVSYPFLWATPVVEWLTDLHTRDRVEIRWHTTWQENALEVGRVLGLPEFGVQDCPEFGHACLDPDGLGRSLASRGMPKWWKYPSAEAILTEEKRSLIWIDDDLDNVSRGMRRVLSATHRVKMYIPNQSTGITPKLMREIDTVLTLWEESPRGALSGS